MSKFFLTRRGPALLVLAALIAATAVVVDETANPVPASAADDGSLDVAFTGPDTILLGENATYTMSAFNNGAGSDLYNVSWRVVLPAGATLVTADLGDPEKTINDSPAAGQTTLLWTNAEDLQVNVTKDHEFTVSFAYPTWEVTDLPNLTAGAYASNDPRQIPDFNTDGTHNDTTDTTAFDEVGLATRIEAIRITKTEPNAESELLRGVHDEWTTYTLNVQNNYVNPTDTIVVEDFLPAGLEFLACGSLDNTATTPITNTHDATTNEYGGSGALGVGVVPSNGNGAAECRLPDEVETVTLTADQEFSGQAAGVYTRVRWVLTATDFAAVYGDGDLDAGESFEIIYAAGIPLRANEAFAAPRYPGSATGEAAALDNNTGALTTDEQNWTNWARATGNYHPGVLDMATQSEDSEIVIAEDLSIHKTVSSPTFVQGDVHQWSLLVETGEYRSASNVVITDQLPDGLCPLLIGSNPETSAPINAECNPIAGREPQVAGANDDPDIVTENADGSWTLVWNVLPTMTVSDDFLVTFWTVARANYQEANADALPVVGGDHWQNTVDIIGTTTPRTDAGGNDIDRAQEPDTVDASQAGQTTSTVVIDKEISQPAAAGVTLDCGTATWQAVGDANIGYKVGDRVCYRLNVDFTQDLDFRNPQVTDFIPPETVFEQLWGVNATTGQTAANTVEIDNVALVDYTIPSLPAGRAVDAIEWDLGVLSGGDLFVDSTSKNFQVVFSVIVTGDPSDATQVDIVENLGKLTHQNSDHLGGETYSSRDLAGFPMTGPIISLDKRNAEDGQALTDAAETGVQGQTFDFSVTVANDQALTGTTSIDDHSEATNIDVWDILPDRIDCTMVTLVGVDTGETATCYDPADIGYPLGGQTTDGRSVIAYTVLSLAPGDNSTLTYDYTVPANMAAGVPLVNDAGVREYETVVLNTGATNTVAPASNIDESKTPTTTDVISDSATVNIINVTIAKGQTSSDTDADGDNRSGSDSQDQGTQDATVGESITYRFDVAIPEGADLYNAVFSDPVDNETSFVSLDGGQISTDDGATWIDLVIDNASTGAGHFPLPGDDVIVSFDPGTGAWGNRGTLNVTFPATWLNPVAALKDHFWIEFTTVVENDDDRIDSGDNIDNYAYGNWDDVNGDPVPQVASNRARTKVVEPDLTIAKADNGTDSDVPVDGESNVVAGQTVQYTVTVTNAAGGNTSDAWDLVITDVLPLGASFVAFDGANAAITETFVADAPGGSEGTITWTLDHLDTGDSIDLVYTATITPAEVTADQLTNTAAAITTSREQDVAAEERTAANDPNATSRYDTTTTNTVTVDAPDLVIEKVPAPGHDDTDARVGVPFTWELTITNNGSATAFNVDVDDVPPTGWLYVAGSAEIDTGGGFGSLVDPTGGPTGPLLWTDVQSSLAAGASFSIRYDLTPQTSLLALATTGTFDHENDSGVSGEDASGATSDGSGSYGDDNDAADGGFVSDNHTARIRRIDLSVDKSIVDAAPHHYGETITYRVVVTNDHPTETMDTATGVTIRDTLPAGVLYQSDVTSNGTYDDGTGIWTLATGLADGASATLDITVLVNAETAITNHAEVETADQWDVDSTPGNWDDGTGTDEDDNASVSFTPVSADLGNRIWFDIDADGIQDLGEPGIPGVTLRATWIDPNGGSVVVRTTTTDAAGEYGFDDLPRNIAIAINVDGSTLPGGLEQTFELIDNPTMTDPQATNAQGGVLDGIVTQITLDGTTPSYPDVDFGYTGLGSIGDLIWQDDNDDGIVDGGEPPIGGVDVIVTWGGWDGVVGDDVSTIGIDESADDLEFSDTTDGSGNYLIDRLPEGAYQVELDPATLPDGLAPTYDLDGGDDRSTEVTLGAGEDRTDVDFGERYEADIAIAKTSAGEFAIGAENTWTITVTNHGPAVADGDITVTDTLPAGITFIRAESAGFACGVSGQLVTCLALGSIAAGDTSTIDLIVDVAPEAATSVTNQASVVHTGGFPDPDPTNETDDDTVSIPLSVLDIDKELVEDSLVRNKVATWRITVTNYGPSATTGPVTVVDDLPDGLAYVRAESDDMTCSATGTVITCEVDTQMLVDGTASVDLVTIVTADPGVEVSNRAEVFGGTVVGSDPIPESVLDDIRRNLDDADNGLDDALGIEVPATGILDTAETAKEQTLAFTGTEPAQFITLAMALFVLGIAFEVLARRRRRLATI